MDYRERILVEPEIRFGKPTIKSTRITVADVREYMAGGDTEEDVLANFPQLAADDVRACLAFAARIVAETISAVLSAGHARAPLMLHIRWRFEDAFQRH